MRAWSSLIRIVARRSGELGYCRKDLAPVDTVPTYAILAFTNRTSAVASANSSQPMEMVSEIRSGPLLTFTYRNHLRLLPGWWLQAVAGCLLWRKRWSRHLEGHLIPVRCMPVSLSLEQSRSTGE